MRFFISIVWHNIGPMYIMPHNVAYNCALAYKPMCVYMYRMKNLCVFKYVFLYLCEPGMLILVLVLVLKDSLRTFFKSFSLSWSLGVRSLSLSWSLGVRS